MSVIATIKEIAERCGISKPHLDAMNALDGQPLRAEWLEYCLASENYHSRGNKGTCIKAYMIWRDAVIAHCGGGWRLEFTPTGCLLGNGEFYPYPT